MLRILLSIVAMLLYIGTFVSIAWFCDTPGVLRGVVATVTWLTTLGALHLAGRESTERSLPPRNPKAACR